MHDGLESLPVSGSGEDEVAQASAVERSPGIEHLRPEGLDDAAKRRTSGCDDLARDLVGIDDRHAARREELRDGGLAARDAARESNAKGPRGLQFLHPQPGAFSPDRCKYRSTSSGPHIRATQPAAAR